jgi:hypothetical protein
MGSAWVAFQSHSDLDAPAMGSEQLFGQPPVPEIIGNPIDGPAGRDSGDTLGQHVTQPAGNLIGTAEIYLIRWLSYHIGI